MEATAGTARMSCVLALRAGGQQFEPALHDARAATREPLDAFDVTYVVWCGGEVPLGPRRAFNQRRGVGHAQHRLEEVLDMMATVLIKLNFNHTDVHGQN